MIARLIWLNGGGEYARAGVCRGCGVFLVAPAEASSFSGPVPVGNLADGHSKSAGRIRCSENCPRGSQSAAWFNRA